MSATILESASHADEDRDYRSPLHDDPRLFTGQTDAERAQQAERALEVIEPHVDAAARDGEHRLEVLGYAEAALEHEVMRRRGRHTGEPPSPPSDLAA